MDENQFIEHMRRMAQERERIGENMRYEVVDELPETGDINTIYLILQESAVCSDPSTYNDYRMWHFYPEGDWSDWGGIGVRKDDDFDSALDYAMESLDDAIDDIL